MGAPLLGCLKQQQQNFMSFDTSLTHLLARRPEGRRDRLRGWVHAHTDPREVEKLFRRLCEYRTTTRSSMNRNLPGCSKEYQLIIRESPAVNDEKLFDLWAGEHEEYILLVQNPHLDEHHQRLIAERAVATIEHYDPENQKRSHSQQPILVLQHLARTHDYRYQRNQQARLEALLPDERSWFEERNMKIMIGQAHREAIAFEALLDGPIIDEETLLKLFELAPHQYPAVEKFLGHPAASPVLFRKALQNKRGWKPGGELARGFSIHPKAWELEEVRSFLLEQLDADRMWQLAARSGTRWRNYWVEQALRTNPTSIVEKLKEEYPIEPRKLNDQVLTAGLQAAESEEARRQLMRWAGGRVDSPREQ